MLAHYKRILKDAEKRVLHMMKGQIREEGSFYGGCLDKDGIVHVKSTIYSMVTAGAVYCNKDSVYYHDEEVFEAIKIALQYIHTCQHENGLFDLVRCNFYSAPDTAFCIKRMLPFLKYLAANREGEKEEQIYQALYTIVERGANGLLAGGFHTPNHRWAIASNLLDCGTFFDKQELKDAAWQYLNEGIDCNKDGEFAEKSAGNYNRINNDAMITLGDTLKDEQYYEYAVRNLRMMLTYIEPDGSIFTANSTRQDNGKVIYPRDYYLEYLDMGYRRGILEFLDMANYIMHLVDEKRLKAPDYLIHLMNRPDLINLEHEGMWQLKEFSRHYDESGIVRTHRENFVYTLMTGKTGFLYFSNPTMNLEMKVGGSFCEHRAFKAETMEKIDNGFHMEQTMRGWYYLPFKEKPATSDWWKMENDKRDKVWGPNLNIQADVTETEHGVDVHVKTSGVTGAPFRVELTVRGANILWNDQFAISAKPGDTMVLKQGNALFSNETDSLEIGPGFGEHLYISGMFGSEEKSSYAFTLYFTAYTEFDKVIHIRTGHKVR